MTWSRSQVSGSLAAFVLGRTYRVCNLVPSPDLPPTVFRVALWTNAPGKGSWRISCGGGTSVPVVITPAASGSDLVDVPGFGVTVEWVATTASASGDEVSAAVAPYFATPDSWRD